MIKSNIFLIFLLTVLSALLNGCATTTNTGAVGVERKQFMMLSEKQVESMSLQSYNQSLKTANDKKNLFLKNSKLRPQR